MCVNKFRPHTRFQECSCWHLQQKHLSKISHGEESHGSIKMPKFCSRPGSAARWSPMTMVSERRFSNGILVHGLRSNACARIYQTLIVIILKQEQCRLIIEDYIFTYLQYLVGLHKSVSCSSQTTKLMLQNGKV